MFAEMYEQYIGVHLKVTDKFGGRWKYFLFLLERMKVVRTYVAVPFLLAELAFWMAFVIHMMNFGSVAKYIGQFIPKGAWWFIIPLWIVALEILWSRAYRSWHWRHEAYYFALYRYGPDSPRSMLATIIIRIIKGSFMMGYLYVVMYGTDVRLGAIFWETVIKLWPLGALTAALYVFQAIYGYLNFGNSWDWQKKGVLLAVTTSVFGAYYAQFKLFVPNFHIPAIHIPWTWNNQPVTTVEPKYALLGITLAIGLFVVVIGLGLLVNKIIEALSDDINLDIIRDTTLNVWWVTPIIYFALLISIVSFRWYHEIYIPDRAAELAAQQAVAVQTVEPSVTPAPEFTLTPMFTVLPTETLTAIPATQTFTATPAFTATPSPLPTFTSTSTQTLIPSPTETTVMTTTDANALQDMPLSEPISTDARISTCTGSTSSATFQVDFDPKSSYCAGDSGRFNLDAGGFYYITLTVDASDPAAAVARFTLDGNIPADISCTLNGQTFDAKSGYVQLPFSNYNTVLLCPKIGLKAISWSNK